MVYEVMFTGVVETRSTERTVKLQHYPHGPALEVRCCEFTATKSHQIHALKKDYRGWHSVKTTAFCLSPVNRACTGQEVLNRGNSGRLVPT